MLIVTTNPANYQLSKNPVVLGLQTDAYQQVAGVAAQMSLVPSGVNTVGGTFTFIWNKGTVVFTIATTPDNTGTQVRQQGSNTNAQYTVMLADDFNKNYLFSETFTILALNLFGSRLVYISAKNKGVDYDIWTNFVQTNTGWVRNATHATGVNTVYAKNYKIKADLFISTTKVGTQELDPINNICLFDFKTMADANLYYDLPVYNQAYISNCANVMKLFYVNYLERYGDPVINYQVLSTTPAYILKAGILSRDFVGTTLQMEAQYQTPGKFLTRQPRIKKVRETQQEYLYYISPKASSGYTGNLKIAFTISLKNNMPDVVVTSGSVALTQSNVAIIPVGFTQRSLGASVNFTDVKSYTSKLIDAATNAVISEVFTFIPDEDFYVDEQYFLFSNSDGGVDTARFTGLKETSFEVEKETVQHIKLYNTPVTVGELADVNHIVKDKFKHSTGWITQAEADWLQNLFSAEQKFIIAEGKFIPITILTITQPKYNSQTGKTFFEVEYYLADSNPVIK